MASYEDDIFNLPVSGHYDCGYSYGATRAPSPKPIPPPKEPVAAPEPPFQQQIPILPSRPHNITIARPISPPVTLPNSFISRSETTTSDSTEYAREDLSPRKEEFEDDSDITSLSSRKASTFSSKSSLSPSCSVRETVIEPDPLPKHSNPQQLSPTQSRAFAGPRPIHPIRLGRKYVCDSYSGEHIYMIGSGQKLKLSKQFVQKVWDGDTKDLIGTIAVSREPHEIALILKGKDIVLQKESATSTKWCFKPSCLTKKGAFWYWYKDKLRGDIVLCESKKGSAIIARIQKDILSFERPGMSLDSISEISFAAMALAALARTYVVEEDITNLASTMATKTFGEVEDGSISDESEDKQSIVRRLTRSLR